MNSERAEFQLTDAQWPTDDKTLTYSFVGSGSLGFFTDENRWEVLSRTPFGEDTFDPIDFRAAFREAVSAWEDVCGVDLVEVADGADVDIRVGWQRFASGHSDGPGGTLGVANWWFTPAGIRTEATITFDPQDFRFPSLGPGAAGSDPDAFYDTALHEIGHALGISHSNVANVVMSGPPETPYWGGRQDETSYSLTTSPPPEPSGGRPAIGRRRRPKVRNTITWSWARRALTGCTAGAATT